MSRLYLYRTVDSDSDGDPIDFGAVRADTHADALQFVTAYLGELLDEDDPASIGFYLYPICDTSAGVLPSAGPRTRSPRKAR